jgi:hypothetical protein
MLWSNDSTYRGNNQNSDLVFNSPLSEEEFLVRLSDEVSENIKKYIEDLFSKNGRKIINKNWLNSYENMDYLWFAYELEHLRMMYNISQIDPITDKLLPNCGQIPFVQVCLKQNAASDKEFYHKSTVNEYGDVNKPHYVIEFEYSFLRQFIKFLFCVFDDNPQLLAGEGEEKKIVHQYIAPIYRQAPFDKYFNERHDLVGIMIEKATQMLLAHELAHIGGGHLDLLVAHPELKGDKDTLIVLEDDADVQAICWLLGMRFLETKTNKVEISLADLRQELALTIFSVYLLFTWTNSKEERVWSEETMKKYAETTHDHFSYQLRTYRMINVASARMKNLGNWCEIAGFLSLDEKKITKDFMGDTFNEALEMIEAFEKSLHMVYATTESIYELCLDDKISELVKFIHKEQDSSIEITCYNFPWMLGFNPDAQNELKRVHDMWESVREKLLKSGSYCKLRDVMPWTPLAN